MSILDYSYTNARLRYLKSQLLEKEFLKSLVACETIEEIINILSETAYGTDINQAIYLLSGVRGVENGLRNHLVRHVEFLKQRVFSKKVNFLILPILERWDVHNIKVILRAHHAGRPLSEMEESFVPLGKLNMPTLNELAKAVDLKDLIDLLYTLGCRYYEPLKTHLNDYLAERNIQKYELELDKYYFENSFKQVSSGFFKLFDRFDQNKNFVISILSLEIDIINILTGIRLSPKYVEQKEAEEFYIKGGKIVSKDLFLKIYAEESLDKIADILKGTPFSLKVKKAMEIVLSTGFVSPIQRALEELLVEKAYSLFRVYPLSVAPVVAYIWSKYNEVVNLRIILRGKEAQMPPDKIISSLILLG